MTTKVTKESLAEKIRYLESVSKLGLSLNEEYQLEAYRLLADYFDECKHTYGRIYASGRCARCGEKLE
ncbi:hypothetical protein PF627_gp70 [Salmonella virus VSiP]|uniref:Uncharacterized protein n=1 Tax=Salmonella virus VSiP TaxID=2301721 RepID=A0A385EGD1_9CAUD|nr:hypothetical protein PF627_gp70 [Salmonella virus VSiP]AXQ70255.1 hypothetical protein vsip_70 [Salmonella virus VSiP]QFR58982.1 hypothetical protein vsia_70 [Salmonella virus VSiA]